MDCNKLNQSLDELHKLRDDLRSKIDSATESGVGKQEILTIKKELSELSDSTLEEFFPDFEAIFPDLVWKLDKRIRITETPFSEPVLAIAPLSDNQFAVGGQNNDLIILTKTPEGELELSELANNCLDAKGDICTIVPLSGNRFAVGGTGDELGFLTKSPEGEWELSEKVDGLKKSAILTIVPLSDNQFVVGGLNGELGILTKSQDNKWGISEKIGKLDNYISAIIPLSDEQLMVAEGGSRGGLKILAKSPESKWELVEEINEFDGAIHAVIPLPDNQFAIGGYNSKNGVENSGILKILTKSQDNKWQLGEKIEGLYGSIYVIAPLSDNQLAAGGRRGSGELRIIVKSSDGEWKLSKRIEGFKHINAIVPLSENQFMGGGGYDYGEIGIVTSTPLTPEDLKQAIMDGRLKET